MNVDVVFTCIIDFGSLHFVLRRSWHATGTSIPTSAPSATLLATLPASTMITHEPSLATQPSTAGGVAVTAHSRLERLPTELIRQILSHLVPQGRIIGFVQYRSNWDSTLQLRLDDRSNVNDERVSTAVKQPDHGNASDSNAWSCKSLVTTSKTISREARGM